MRTRVKVLVVVFVVLMLFSCLGMDIIPMAPVLTFLFGWAGFIGRVLPQISPNPGGFVMAVLALAVSATLAHSIGSWCWNPSHPQKPWRFKWTAMFLAMVAMMFAAGISVVAITHQTIWLVQTPGRWFVYSGMAGANRVKCASNLRQIGQGVMLYQNDNKKYPTTLGDLFETDLNAEVFLCPDSGKAIPADIARDKKKYAEWVNANSDYVYLGATMKAADPAERILAYEKLENHNGEGVNILYNDGHVEWMMQEGAKKAIEEQTKK